MTQDRVEYVMNMDKKNGEILVHFRNSNCNPENWPEGEGKPSEDWRGPYAAFGAAVIDAEVIEKLEREVRMCRKCRSARRQAAEN